MSIWRTAPVETAPVVELSQWSVFQTETGQRHFVGYNTRSGEGRVSSAIVEFDPKTLSGLTTTGRLYQLIGPPGVNSDAEYVKHRWLNINKVSEHFDVTDDYK